MQRITLAVAGIGLAVLGAAPARAQLFERITDPANAIVTHSGAPRPFVGASWIDSDADGDVDLFVSGAGLFRNDGAGAFVHLPGAVAPQPQAPIGHSWADVDNDGDLDVYVSGGSPDGSFLFLNQGGNVFAKVTTGPIGQTAQNMSWSCAFGDWDDDGRIDLVTAAAFLFAGIESPNRLFHNEGASGWTRVDTSQVRAFGPFTIPSWTDLDSDGDLDLTIGAGPANGSTARDYLYLNRSESAFGWLRRYDVPPLGTDLQDGQLYNWIDYDNDGDLDGFLTNWVTPNLVAGGLRNRLYRNDGGGTWTRRDSIGPIVTDALLALASVWEDFDLDGDLDAIVTSGGSPCFAYRNQGDGTFAAWTLDSITNSPGPHWGAAAGDWDDDGDSDLYLTGPPGRAWLYRNVQSSTHGWFKLRLVGVTSNRAAIGARIRVRAVIGGVPRWQMRELSAQNSFGGMSSLEQTFGLGDAAQVDSVLVEWPGGAVTTHGPVPRNSRRTYSEDGTLGVGPARPAPDLAFGVRAIAPNPGHGPWRVSLALASAAPATLEVLDLAGRRVLVRTVAAGARAATLALPEFAPPGVYVVRVRQGTRTSARRAVLLR